MSEPAGNLNGQRPRPHYNWPWILLGAVLLGLGLAVLWMSQEIRRTRLRREANPLPANAAGPGKTP